MKQFSKISALVLFVVIWHLVFTTMRQKAELQLNSAVAEQCYFSDFVDSVTDCFTLNAPNVVVAGPCESYNSKLGLVHALRIFLLSVMVVSVLLIVFLQNSYAVKIYRRNCCMRN